MRIRSAQRRGSANLVMAAFMLVLAGCVASAERPYIEESGETPTAPESSPTSATPTSEESGAAATSSDESAGASTTEPPDPRPCASWIADGEFLISGYSVPTASRGEAGRTMAELAEAGYTHVGPFYGTDSRAETEEAAAAGLCLVHHLGRPEVDRDSAAANPDGWAEEIRSQLTAAIADPLLNSMVSVWMILPEELDVNRRGHESLMVLLSEVISEVDPLDRPVSMFITSNADDAEFVAVATHLGVISQGQYLVNDLQAHERAHLPFRVERAIRAAADNADGRTSSRVVPVLEHGVSDREMEPGDQVYIERWVRHDILSAIASGADGFISFSHAERGQPAEFLRYNDAYAREIGLLEGSELIAAPFERTVLDVEVLEGPATQPVTEVLGQGDQVVDQTSSQAVELVRGENRWIIVVNHADVALRVRIDGVFGRFDELGGSASLVGDAAGSVEILLEPFSAILAREAP